MSTTQRLTAASLAVLAGAAGCSSKMLSGQPSFTFTAPPPWTQIPQLSTASDITNDPRFRTIHHVYGSIVACRATDGRHVVLALSPAYTSLRDKVRQGGQVVYASPGGFRAWRGGPEKWYSEKVLKSARSTIKDSPSPQRCGYVIEAPSGEMAILAVNGELTEAELRSLIDNLAPTKTPNMAALD